MLRFLFACTTATSQPIPEPTPEPTPLPLYEQLYAGEHGHEARILGDKARIRVWLAALSLSPAQHQQLLTHAQDAHGLLAAHATRIQALEADELARLAPMYQRIASLPLTELSTQAPALTLELAAARDAEIPKLKAETARKLSSAAEVWLKSLEPAQRIEARRAVFFLRGANLDPILTQLVWPDAQFASMKRLLTVEKSVEDPSADYQGLWRLDTTDVPVDPMLTLAPPIESLVAVLALCHPVIIEVLSS